MRNPMRNVFLAYFLYISFELLEIFKGPPIISRFKFQLFISSVSALFSSHSICSTLYCYLFFSSSTPRLLLLLLLLIYLNIAQFIKTSNLNRNCAYEFNNDASSNQTNQSTLNQNQIANNVSAQALSRTFKSELEEILVRNTLHTSH